MLKKEVEAWETGRNKKHAKADWQFTTEDARVKLKRLYHYASPYFRLNPPRNKRIQPATVAFHKESGPAGPDS